jgi:hypothetical protein
MYTNCNNDVGERLYLASILFKKLLVVNAALRMIFLGRGGGEGEAWARGYEIN